MQSESLSLDQSPVLSDQIEMKISLFYQPNLQIKSTIRPIED